MAFPGDSPFTAAQDKDASPHIAVLRIQGPLCFANAARTKERILNLKVLPRPADAGTAVLHSVVHAWACFKTGDNRMLLAIAAV